MKIFCIGYNKTGTTSVYKSIIDLGFKGTNLERGERMLHHIVKDRWDPIWDFCESGEVFKDIPFSVPGVWKAIYEKYPDAKYVLTERTTSKQWYNSILRFHSTKFSYSKDPSWDEVYKLKYGYYWLEEPGGMMSDYMRKISNHPTKPYDRETLISSYESHNSEVKEFFKNKDNFITIDVAKDHDYMKLCSFLGRYPKFPHLNNSKGLY